MKPVLKWVGGKRWLLPILELIWASYKNHTLVEPFTGGMAVSLGLNPNEAILNDANIHLINLYRQIRKGLRIHLELQNNADYYYEMRRQFNLLIEGNQYFTKEAASIFYFLIRTGFNGLCRFNNSGQFNVPFGQHKTIKYKTDFLEYQTILKKWQFTYGDFQMLSLTGDEFVYADPPYDVAFTKYHTQNFHWDNQVQLAHWLNQHPGPVVTSNQATERILKLYQDLKFHIFLISAPRSVSCKGDKRLPAIEILALKGFKIEFIKKMKNWPLLTYYQK